MLALALAALPGAQQQLSDAAECASFSGYFWDGARCHPSVAACQEYSTDDFSPESTPANNNTSLKFYGCARCLYGYYGPRCLACTALKKKDECNDAKHVNGSAACAWTNLTSTTGVCLLIIDHCKTPSDIGCEACYAGYFGWDCAPCAGATANECRSHSSCAFYGNKCNSAVDNCVAYLTGGNSPACTVCASGYYLNGAKCDKKADVSALEAATCGDYAVYDSDNKLCLRCGSYSGSSNPGEKLSDYCDRDPHCHWAAGECKYCAPGFEYDESANKCVNCSEIKLSKDENCPEYCLYYNKTYCGNYPAHCTNATGSSDCSFTDKGYPTACESGYTPALNKCFPMFDDCLGRLSTDECRICNSNFHREDPAGREGVRCIPNAPFCEDYSTAGKCMRCARGYARLKDGVCLKCPPGCVDCIRQSSISAYCLPDACETGFELVTNGGFCTKKIAHCAELTPARNKCSKCDENAYSVTYNSYNARYCVPCAENCAKCDENGCTTCNTGFIEVNGKCLLPCPSAFYRNATGVCTSCGPAALSCTFLTDTVTITACYDGFYLADDACKRCASSCDTCEGSVAACTKCAAGYSSYTGTLESIAEDSFLTLSCHKCTGCVTCTALACVYDNYDDYKCQDGWEYLESAPANAQSLARGCYERCPTAGAFYFDALNRCKPCPASLVGCAQCKSATYCLEGNCYEGYYYKGGNCVRFSALRTVGTAIKAISLNNVLTITGCVIAGIVAGAALGVLCSGRWRRYKRYKSVAE